MIGTTTALILAGISAGATIGTGVYAAKKAGQAAKTQADAASQASTDQLDASKYSSDQILQASREANQLQELMYLLGREDVAPYREVGGGALMTLQDLMQPEGYLAEQYPEFRGQMQFDPGTGQVNPATGKVDMGDVGMDPGFEFRMKEGQKALERSAAAKGGVLSGATLKAMERYAQDFSSGEYSNTHNRTYGRSLDSYNQALERYRTNYGVDQGNKANLYNRLASLAGIGQTAAGTSADLGSNYAAQSGANTQNAATNAANVNMAGVRGASDAAQSAAAARASGYAASGNIYGNMMGQLANLPMQYLTLSSLLKKPTSYTL